MELTRNAAKGEKPVKKLIVLFTLIFCFTFTACGVSNSSVPGQSSPESVYSREDTSAAPAPGSSENQASQLEAAPIEEILPLFREKAKSYLGLDIQKIEPLGDLLIQDETWYKFRITTEYESIVYLVNADISRIYTETSEYQSFLPDYEYPTVVTMREVYDPIEEPVLLVSQEEQQRLEELLFPKLLNDAEEGKGSPGGSFDIKIVNNEFCLVMTAAYTQDYETIYMATYAISLDGERYYKLGDDGYFHALMTE